ncbi:hypothetical protein HPB51_027336 [Rhipicephalus microplus]|uniref:THAP-type domain-containing protein n=1 Tax=Rhipicephalus microplus TaxID=6941 RepID=A0A9J6D0H5_RHIMP|nr:hypothetical protein HPB51_027336 [Rhipicephalus microplus]
MPPTPCAVKGCDSKTRGNVSMHSFPNNPAVRQVWVDCVCRDRSCDWTPAKRSRICWLHFSPDYYRIKNHRYLLEFSIALPTSDIWSQKLCSCSTLLLHNITMQLEHRSPNASVPFQQTIELHWYVTIFCECLSPYEA